MSSPENWRALVAALPPHGLCVLGVGSELKADDAAGMLLIERLREQLPERDDLLLIAGSTAPENFTGQIKQFRPQQILLVDAAQLGREAGEIAVIPPEEIKEASLSTHMLPLSFMIDYLHQELGCPIAMLGVQLVSTEMGQPMAEPVRQAVAELAAALIAQVK